MTEKTGSDAGRRSAVAYLCSCFRCGASQQVLPASIEDSSKQSGEAKALNILLELLDKTQEEVKKWQAEAEVKDQAKEAVLRKAEQGAMFKAEQETRLAAGLAIRADMVDVALESQRPSGRPADMQRIAELKELLQSAQEESKNWQSEADVCRRVMTEAVRRQAEEVQTTAAERQRASKAEALLAEVRAEVDAEIIIKMAQAEDGARLEAAQQIAAAKAAEMEARRQAAEAQQASAQVVSDAKAAEAEAMRKIAELEDKLCASRAAEQRREAEVEGLASAMQTQTARKAEAEEMVADLKAANVEALAAVKAAKEEAARGAAEVDAMRKAILAICSSEASVQAYVQQGEAASAPVPPCIQPVPRAPLTVPQPPPQKVVQPAPQAAPDPAPQPPPPPPVPPMPSDTRRTPKNQAGYSKVEVEQGTGCVEVNFWVPEPPLNQQKLQLCMVPPSQDEEAVAALRNAERGAMLKAEEETRLALGSVLQPDMLALAVQGPHPPASMSDCRRACSKCRERLAHVCMHPASSSKATIRSRSPPSQRPPDWANQLLLGPIRPPELAKEPSTSTRPCRPGSKVARSVPNAGTVPQIF